MARSIAGGYDQRLYYKKGSYFCHSYLCGKYLAAALQYSRYAGYWELL